MKREHRMFIPPKRIVFTGGGLRSLCHYGVLQVLEEKGLLKHVKEYIGVSAGALIGLTQVLGYSITEISKAVTEFDFSILQNAHPELVLEFFTNYGIDSGERLEQFVCSLLRVKGYSAEITFQEWSAQHPNSPRLRCYACNLNTNQIKEFSLEKTPDISLVFALRASMCLPLYFTPVKDPETGDYLVDGGVVQNFPMNYLTEDEKETALGISFQYGEKEHNVIEDFPGFLHQMYNCSFNPRTYQVQKENLLRCIIIPTTTMTAYNFDLTKEFRENLLSLGQKAAEEFLANYLNLITKHQKPVRRYSVA